MGVFLVEWRLCFFKNDTIVQELSRNLVFHDLQLKKMWKKIFQLNVTS